MTSKEDGDGYPEEAGVSLPGGSPDTGLRADEDSYCANAYMKADELFDGLFEYWQAQAG